MKMRRALPVATLFAATWFATGAQRAIAAEEVIDDFDAAADTAFVSGMQVAATFIGMPVTRKDVGLPAVLGGSRELTVSVQGNMFEGSLFTTAGVDPLQSLFILSEDAMVEGRVVLEYDGDGAGLNRGLSFAQGLRVTVTHADLPCMEMGGTEVTMTLVDVDQVSASSTETLTQSGGPTALDFPFSDFASVDVTRIFSVAIDVNPLNPMGACDLQFDAIATFGTPETEPMCGDGFDNDNNGQTDCGDPACFDAPECLAPAPTLSPLMVGFLVLCLGMIGALEIIRLRRAMRAATVRR
jgi:hypothetical protein